MSLDQIDSEAPQLVPEDRPFEELYQTEERMTPARRAALAALEREFHDLLGTRS